MSRPAENVQVTGYLTARVVWKPMYWQVRFDRGMHAGRQFRVGVNRASTPDEAAGEAYRQAYD
jgi:hypothetical protein